MRSRREPGANEIERGEPREIDLPVTRPRRLQRARTSRSPKRATQRIARPARRLRSSDAPMCGPITATARSASGAIARSASTAAREHARRESAPARVRGGDRARRRRDQHRQAVGGDDADRQRRARRRRARRRRRASAVVAARRAHHRAAVHLPRAHESAGATQARVPKPCTTPRVEQRMAQPAFTRAPSRRAATSSAAREVGRQRRFEAQAFAARRVREAEHGRVQRGSREAELLAAASVDRIADDRQSRRDERWTRIWCVRPVAGRTSSSATPLVAKRCATRHCGLRRAARSRAHRHALAIGRVATDRALDSARVGARHAAHQRAVDALDAVILELRGERDVRGVALGDDQHARRAAIEPVHDAGPQHAADAGEIAAVVQQRVHERAARVTGRRMHDEPGGLVDHDQVGVLVEHDERDRLGLRVERRRLGRIDGDHGAGGDALRRRALAPSTATRPARRSSAAPARAATPASCARAASSRCPARLSSDARCSNGALQRRPSRRPRGLARRCSSKRSA